MKPFRQPLCARSDRFFVVWASGEEHREWPTLGGAIHIRSEFNTIAHPTAIFACNNFLAIGVIETLREAQIDVPQDMAVVSFDDIELASALYPFLTVVAQPARTFGTIAMQFLLDRLNGDEALAPRKVVLPPDLIVRMSCGVGLSNTSTSV